MAHDTKCTFKGDLLRMPICDEILGRTFNGSGILIDHGASLFPDDYLLINVQLYSILTS